MILLLASLGLFLLLGIPVAYSLALSSLTYFVFIHPEFTVVLPQRLFAGMNSYALIALPLFILMGQIMNASGITERLISFCLIFVGRLRGGLGLVNVAASMLFGGISGSSASDTASIGSILIPEMTRRGYPKDSAAGITVASSTMGMIIPPSIPMVIYAVAAQESVGRLFLGGLVPGVLVAVFQLCFTYWLACRRGYPNETVRYSARRVVAETLRASYVLIMPVFVVGTVVFGIATATESAGLGVLYAVCVGFLLTRLLKPAGFYRALRSSIQTSAKIMIIIATSQVFIWVLALERVPETVAGVVVSLGLPPVVMLLLISLIVLIAGTFIDVSPAILLLTPVFLPTVIQAEVSPVLFGVILVCGLAVGACTPPVGNCLNVCSFVSGLRIGTIFQAAVPFLAANVIVLILITLFPKLVLWIPRVLMD
ncbi:TRAP transporter large permease [Acidobacteria bacterium AH-259-O06]|nr:TRAP transporter large permease [Acidobacteria bacterium AH-259-O06]